ncbi:MAG: response regulator, partial [Sulfurimonadaceae bacterium]|nr:response regulator [Sulfurimonadaceae bacterium]
MKKILVVDDDNANREFIATLCEDYADQHAIPVTVVQAENGAQALERCQEDEIDMIFMDIMMPQLDGIEATRQIRNQNKDVMIIAVSAAEDEAYQNTILQVGAEDFIKKPVVSTLFFKRFDHYHNLYNQRQRLAHCELYNPMVHNLYTNSVYNTLISYAIETEECLALFWEEMLVFNTLNNTNEHFSDLIRNIYFIASAMIGKEFRSKIYIEQDATHHYFSIGRINLLDVDQISRKLKRNFPECEFRIDGSRISFALPKHEVNGASSRKSGCPAIDRPAEVAETEAVAGEEQALTTFDFISREHLEDLEATGKNLNSVMLFLRNSEINDEEVDDIVNALRAMADILTIYDEIYRVGEAVESLADAIDSDRQVFQERSKEMA